MRVFGGVLFSPTKTHITLSGTIHSATRNLINTVRHEPSILENNYITCIKITIEYQIKLILMNNFLGTVIKYMYPSFFSQFSIECEERWLGRDL